MRSEGQGLTTEAVPTVPPVLAALFVFASSHPKVRLGRKHDGGYVVASGLAYDHFLSGGICGDISFEHHFLELHPDLTCDAYDHSIERLPVRHPRIAFHRQMVGPRGNTLQSYLDGYANVFVKMDIEGGEFSWLDGLTDTQTNSIAQLVMEVHWPSTRAQWDALARLARTHYLIHLHGNNHGGLTNVSGVMIPEVFECTYVRNDLEAELALNQGSIPSPLDMPNNPGAADIGLSWPPFVNSPMALGCRV
jgi:hypothetical protein